MSWHTILLLVAAGFAGGVSNAIAGGATLITFPAMLAAGLPPLIANASNAVAVTPGALVAALADRKRLPRPDRAMGVACLATLLGGTAGAVLLLVTPASFFTLLVPALVGIATLIFAFASQIQRGVARLFGETASSHPAFQPVLLVVTSIYGGYFGAGLGVMLLAVLALTGLNDVRGANALKNVLATLVSFVTVAIFCAKGVVSWPETALMLAGATAGGFAGGILIRVLPPKAVRALICTLGTTMTAIYAWRYWF